MKERIKKILEEAMSQSVMYNDENLNVDTLNIDGMIFKAVRQEIPYPHWNLKLPTGEVWENGTAGVKMDTKPHMWKSLLDLYQRVGADRFRQEVMGE